MAISTVKVKCQHCGNEFEKMLSEYNRRIKKNTTGFFCNLKCSGNHFDTKHLAKYRKIYNKKIKNYAGNRLDQYSPFKYHANKTRSRSKEKGYKTDITAEYLKEIWEKQEGICPYTKIKMDISKSSTGKDIKKNPTKASLDRIDPNIGYAIGNVEFVCYSINVMKSDFTKDQMISFINLIKNPI